MDFHNFSNYQNSDGGIMMQELSIFQWSHTLRVCNFDCVFLEEVRPEIMEEFDFENRKQRKSTAVLDISGYQFLDTRIRMQDC